MRTANLSNAAVFCDWVVFEFRERRIVFIFVVYSLRMEEAVGGQEHPRLSGDAPYIEYDIYSTLCVEDVWPAHSNSAASIWNPMFDRIGGGDCKGELCLERVEDIGYHKSG